MLYHYVCWSFRFHLRLHNVSDEQTVHSQGENRAAYQTRFVSHLLSYTTEFCFVFMSELLRSVCLISFSHWFNHTVLSLALVPIIVIAFLKFQSIESTRNRDCCEK